MHKQPPWFWLILWLLPAVVQGQDVFTLTAESLQNGQAVELDKLGWKYLPDDDPRFADPQFDDRAWETLNGTAITLNSIPKSGWRGIGWFRLHLQVDPALANQPLALVMVHFGASEIYLDGKLIERFGTVGATPETEVAYNPNRQPFEFVLDEREEHVLSIRYSCQAMGNLTNWWGKWVTDFFRLDGGAGFSVSTTRSKQAFTDDANLRTEEAYHLLRVGLLLAIGLLYLLLYGFHPQQRASLFFGLYACSVAAGNAITNFFMLGHPRAEEMIFWGSVNVIIYTLWPGLLLAFLYATFTLRFPKWFWFWLATSVLYFVSFTLLFPSTGTSARFYLGLPIHLFPLVEIGRIGILAIRKRQTEAWGIGVGAFVFMLHSRLIAYDLVSTTATMRNVATLLLIAIIATYLARQFARTSRHLEEQLIQVKQLSAAALEHEKVKAEHDRKTKELEEARQLQLSMLPKKLPQLPHLDLAAYMKTATEVGGDYYDFHTSEDGTLTIAVGDATGHGLKAGTMVASVKSLFMTLAYHPDIPHIFTRLSQTLKGMNLRGLFMAMTIAKVKENRLTISIAGMPPVWIYRASCQQIEEVALKQLPLGGVTKYVYQQNEYELASGDVVVLLSDGLPERFNEEGIMLEDEAAKKFIATNAHLSAQDLINGLATLGDKWGGARPQDDDVTLVVLKLK